MPKISVIVPVFNVEPYIHRCVDSILNQTFTEFELILVDDGSPDNCGKICDEYAEKDNRVYVIHKDNGGLSDARNAGMDWAFKNSDSEWITFIDSDDWVHNKYLELLYDAAIKNNCEVSCCAYKEAFDNIDSFYIIDKNEMHIEYGSADTLLQNLNSFKAFNVIIACARLYKKDLFEHIRFPIGKYFEDSYTIYKTLYSCNKIAVVNYSLYYYYQNPNGIINSELTIRKVSDTFDSFLEKLAFFYQNNYIYSFQIFFSEYCQKFEKYHKKYKNVPEYRSVFLFHRKNIKYLQKKYRSMLPPLLKKYGYKKWINGRAERIVNFNEDIVKVQKQKGPFFSFLWAIKNYWRI